LLIFKNFPKLIAEDAPYCIKKNQIFGRFLELKILLTFDAAGLMGIRNGKIIG